MLNNWVLSGIGAAICFTGMTLVIKKLLLIGINPLVLNMFLFGFVLIGFICWVSISKTPVNFSWAILALLILAAVFSLLGNFLDVTAIKLAPNPGYASTLKASQIALITLLSPILLGAALSIRALAGVVLVFVGVLLLSMK
jgi:uncharacterized membrane protein